MTHKSRKFHFSLICSFKIQLIFFLRSAFIACTWCAPLLARHVSIPEVAQFISETGAETTTPFSIQQEIGHQSIVDGNKQEIPNVVDLVLRDYQGTHEIERPKREHRGNRSAARPMPRSNNSIRQTPVLVINGVSRGELNKPTYRGRNVETV